MKTLKWIGIVLLILIVLITVFSLFLPKEFNIEKTKTIDAPVWSVFEEVADYHNWTNWSYWYQKDTAMKIEYSGTKKGKGALRSWESKIMGNGKMEIIECVKNKFIKNELYFMDSKEPTFGTWNFEETEEGTIVTWVISGESSLCPIAKIQILLGKKMLGKAMNAGLENLSELCKAKPKELPIDVTLSSIDTIRYLAIKVIVTDKTMLGAKYGEAFGKLSSFFKENEILPAGYPFSTAIQWSEKEGDTIILEVAFPINKELEIPEDENVYLSVIPAGNIVTAMHLGKYEDVGNEHGAIMKWIQENDKKINGHPWETYITDPTMEPDTTKWKTKVCYPVN